MGIKQTVWKIGEFEKLNFVKPESDYKRLLRHIKTEKKFE